MLTLVAARRVSLLPSGWVVLNLRDGYFGNPEYKASIEEVTDGTGQGE